MNRTAHYGGIGGGPQHMIRTLTRSFDTLEAAQKFAEGKRGADVFKRRGRYAVEWQKVCRDYDDDGNKVPRYDFDSTPFYKG